MAPHAVLAPLDVARPDSTTRPPKQPPAPATSRWLGRRGWACGTTCGSIEGRCSARPWEIIVRNYTRYKGISATTMVSYNQQIPQGTDAVRRSTTHHSTNLHPRPTRVSSQRVLRLFFWLQDKAISSTKVNFMLHVFSLTPKSRILWGYPLYLVPM